MLLVVGQILRPHGIRGELVVDVRTDEPDQRFAVGSVLVTDSTAVRRLPQQAVDAGAITPPPRLVVEHVRPHHGRLLIEFEGIADRNVAEAMRGVLLCVDSSAIAATDDPDEFHDHQLVGLVAVDADGAKLGEVVRVEHAPASDLLVLRLPDGRQGLVPFVKSIVPHVDLAGGRVVVTPPEGLFDL